MRPPFLIFPVIKTYFACADEPAPFTVKSDLLRSFTAPSAPVTIMYWLATVTGVLFFTATGGFSLSESGWSYFARAQEERSFIAQ